MTDLEFEKWLNRKPTWVELHTSRIVGEKLARKQNRFNNIQMEKKLDIEDLLDENI